MSTGMPTNTIDFNRAKLGARIAEFSNRLQPGGDIQGRLTRKLQMTLDLEEQLALFVDALSEIIEIDGIRYVNEAPWVHLQSERMGMHRCHYNIKLPQEELGEITLSRSRRFLEPELKVIEQMLGILVYPLRNALRYKAALDAAMTDALTGVCNKRSFELHLQREMDLADRHRGELSLILVDLDYFKSINDTYGHLTGDAVLKEVAKRIRATCRQSDLCFRIGGEEFALLLSSTDANGALVIAERVRQAIAASPITLDDLSLQVTASLGVSSFKSGQSQDSFLREADEALYRAKRQGRNQVQVHQAED